MSLLKSSIPTPLFRRPSSEPGLRSPFARAEPEAAPPPPAAPPAPAVPQEAPATPKPVPKAKAVHPKPKPPKPPPDPRKGGRPRHNPETVRDRKLTISLSVEEAEVLAGVAAASGMAFSAWIRHLCFDVARVAPRPHPENALISGGNG